MSRGLVTVGPGLVGSGVIRQLLAAGREVRSIVERPTRAAPVRAMLDTGKVQSGARLSFSVADRDDDAGRLDAVSGCEFLDDRIRLRE
jgi:dihydroflavonol-4-reductase